MCWHAGKAKKAAPAEGQEELADGKKASKKGKKKAAKKGPAEGEKDENAADSKADDDAPVIILNIFVDSINHIMAYKPEIGLLL